jgi:hypothetical protein
MSDILVLEGTMVAAPAQKDDCREMLSYLNPSMRIVGWARFFFASHRLFQTNGSDAYVDVSLLVQTNLYNGEDHAGSVVIVIPGDHNKLLRWHKIMHDHFAPPSCKAVQHCVFKARRPFHPVYVVLLGPSVHHRIVQQPPSPSASRCQCGFQCTAHEFVSTSPHCCVKHLGFRSMGYVWLATRHSMFGVWSSSGPVFTLVLRLNDGQIYASLLSGGWRRMVCGGAQVNVAHRSQGNCGHPSELSSYCDTEESHLLRKTSQICLKLGIGAKILSSLVCPSMLTMQAMFSPPFHRQASRSVQH